MAQQGKPITEQMSDAVAAAGQKAGETVEAMKQKAADASGKAAEMQHRVGETAEQAKNRMGETWTINLILTTPDASLAEVSALLDGPPMIEGLPVVDADKKLVGVVSKKDLSKGGSTVKDIMSTPPVALKASGKVTDAAKCMVEHRFHRVPVVDNEGMCVGIVTRTDIFFVLSAADQDGDSYFRQEGIDVHLHLMSTCASTCCRPVAAPARAALGRPRRAGATARAPTLVARGNSTDVHLGGELHEVVQSAAASDDILNFFVQQHNEAGNHRTKSKRLGDIMQKQLVTASPEEPLAEVEARLKGIEGAPVVDAAGKLVGVLSKKDYKKGGTLVKDVMTAKPIALGPQDKVTEAAHTMIDNKIHRVPVADEQGVCIGIVTRTTLFWELASDSDRTSFFHEHGIDI
ncbi:inosine-5 -monophosphate dehydrogenase [Micractinium conductrix]|uniref:Inosine-5 -monophosphate dehydrogenase n=1 Tax=Micractinium conductrix TaxID=554055 RepID=A0A2P6V3E9_9CHLO|nr:inosine-5 -monophosphate dehydrogenase [Micractinium conductrix]|eukprot:PSC68621.1 inosine-5 -monophosphate dehydrogenase [Micractinium conductrix]